MSTVNYLLRDIDPALWRKFKTRAAKDGVSMRDVLISFLIAYVKGVGPTRTS